MKDNTGQRKFLVSPWPFVVAAILFALLGFIYLDLYSRGHWSVMATASSIWFDSREITFDVVPKVLDDDAKKQITMMSERMMDYHNKLQETGRKIMGSGTAYLLSPIISLVFTAFAFACKPRWGGILSLPFSLIAMKCCLIIM